MITDILTSPVTISAIRAIDSVAVTRHVGAGFLTGQTKCLRYTSDKTKLKIIGFYCLVIYSSILIQGTFLTQEFLRY